MYCNLCGDENGELTVRRYWDCDDGWQIARLCSFCWEDVRGERPDPDDYAFDKAGEYYTETQAMDLEDVEAFIFG